MRACLLLLGFVSAGATNWFGHADFDDSDPRFLKPFLRGTADESDFMFPSDPSNTLAPHVYKPLKVGSHTPKGWLLSQLKLQAQGLSGHLSQFWNDVQNSIWIGGKGDGGLHERTPYWLNGIVPLAFLLKNAGIDELPGVTGIYMYTGGEWNGPGEPPAPVNIMEQCTKYINAILAYQHEDGWIGPNQTSGDDYWGRSNVMFSMLQYAEAEPDQFANVTSFMLKYMLSMKERLPKKPLDYWAQERWQDMAFSAHWLLENAPQGHEQDLWDLANTLHTQGVNWEQWFDTFTGNGGGHNVNDAQGLKSAAVWYRQSKNESLRTLSRTRMEHMDERYGLPTGMYNGDENLPQPATRSPSRGIELCGVVEAMFSYNTMFATHGDVIFADRAEKIAYNALPATWASPKGGDMWAHQYLQAINQVNALEHADPHVWQSDGPQAEMYGLEPNFGCCTANFNQGWPKFANMIVFETGDGGAAIGVYAPTSAALPGGSIVDVDTNYPFDDKVTITVTAKKAMPLYLRIPAWADKATVDGAAAQANSMHKVDCKAGSTTVILAFDPQIRLESADRVDANGTSKDLAFSVHRGSLMYSLPLKGNYTIKAHHWGPDESDGSNDYEVLTSDEWAFALSSRVEDMKFVQNGYHDGAAPFNTTNWPTYITAKVRSVPGWGMKTNAADTPPSSPACGGVVKCGEPMEVKLVPHGATDLRIGMMPLA